MTGTAHNPNLILETLKMTLSQPHNLLTPCPCPDLDLVTTMFLAPALNLYQKPDPTLSLYQINFCLNTTYNIFQKGGPVLGFFKRF